MAPLRYIRGCSPLDPLWVYTWIPRYQEWGARLTACTVHPGGQSPDTPRVLGPILLWCSGEVCLGFEVPGTRWGVGARLTAVHCRSRHDCFMRPGPPNFFMSRQKWQSPHSVRTQARQRRQRVRRRRAPAPGPRLLDDIGGVSNAEGCEQMGVRSDRPA